jgi:hypothetical protein
VRKKIFFFASKMRRSSGGTKDSPCDADTSASYWRVGAVGGSACFSEIDVRCAGSMLGVMFLVRNSSSG